LLIPGPDGCTETRAKAELGKVAKAHAARRAG
jgi:hypothetical protein